MTGDAPTKTQNRFSGVAVETIVPASFVLIRIIFKKKNVKITHRRASLFVFAGRIY